MKHILCFGDSNTWGYIPGGCGRRHPEGVRWTSILSSKLGDDFRIYECGLCGRTTVYEEEDYIYRDGSRLLPATLDICDPLDLVIIMLGSNDVKSAFDQTPEQITSGMETLVNQVESFTFGPETENGTPKILIVAPAPLRDTVFPSDMGFMYDEASMEKSKNLAPLYKKLAEKHGCTFFDAGSVTSTSDEDGLHLSPEAHRELAEGLYGVVSELFKG